MTTITLYTGGGVSLSPQNGEGRTVSNYVRLVADDGKALQKGELVSTCVDVLASDVQNWTEIDEPPAPEDELTDSEALEIILGGGDA